MSGPWEKYQAQSSDGPWNKYKSADSAQQTEQSVGTVKNTVLGALKGASDIGTTILSPVAAVVNAVGGKGTMLTGDERRAALKQFFEENANPESLAFKGGELAADIAGTAGAGGALAKGVTTAAKVVPALVNVAPKLAAALESGGFSLGGTPAATVAGKVGNAAIRVGSGAAVGGTSAGLISPDDASTGAILGGALPAVAKVAGMAGNRLASEVSPEVANLYQKAKSLGIDIPADRIVNSRPLNALASSLNYVPLSGRAATEEKMLSQFNRAVSRTFGQDSENVTASLRKASGDLGKKFDDVLSNNTVKVDNQFLDDLVQHAQRASDELGTDGAKIIGKQIDEIIAKSANGEIDGQAAYNIKKTLDRIGNRNTPEAYYARDLKKSLMGALNRSLPGDEAKAFAKTRQQYGNMLDIENLAQSGAEGGVSVGRLANLKNIKNRDLQDLADIAAQFIKTRENPHGAAQRVTLGALGAITAPAAVAASIFGGGRAANAMLNSNIAKNALINRQVMNDAVARMASNPVGRAALISAVSANP